MSACRDALTRVLRSSLGLADTVARADGHCQRRIGERDALQTMLADDGPRSGRLARARPAAAVPARPGRRAEDFVATSVAARAAALFDLVIAQAHPEQVHLTVGAVRYHNAAAGDARAVALDLPGRSRAPGQKVRVFIQPSHEVRPATAISAGHHGRPGDRHRPVPRVPSGTATTPGNRQNWLFFGDQKSRLRLPVPRRAGGYPGDGCSPA